jgi:hypothetical protein
LRKAFQKGELRFHGELKALAQPEDFEALCQKASQIEWVVYAKRPFGGPEQALKYLARYTHRIAISNRRLISMTEGRVTFEWKDYADGMSVAPSEGAIMAAPYGAKAPGLDVSEGARSL